jgi:ankyrin repeat protein
MACEHVDVTKQWSTSISKLGLSPLPGWAHVDVPKQWRIPNTGLGSSLLRGREIRLLKLLPGEIGSPIRCEVKVVALDGSQVYTALSYAWGNPPAECTIIINGHEVKIRKNLLRFLQQARSLPEPLFDYIWIDALCVNQTNDGERTHQVALMGDIYATAERVIAWLGPAHDSSDQAIEDIQTASPKWTTRKSFPKKWVSPASTGIRSICVRRYWKRLWIFQELLLARQAVLMCGSRRIPLQCFRDFVLKISSCYVSDHAAELFELQCVRDSPAVKIMQYIAQRRAVSSIFDLMIVTRDLRCSDVRDRVFAVLSVDAGPTRTVLPDYKKSIPHLVNSVLRDHHAFQAPTGLDKITERCRELSKIMRIDMQDIFSAAKDDLKWSESMPFPDTALADSSTITMKAPRTELMADDEPVTKKSTMQSDHRQDYEHAQADPYGGTLHGVPVTFIWAARWQHTAVVDLLLCKEIVKARPCMIAAIKADHYAVVAVLLQSRSAGLRETINRPLANSANALQIAVAYDRLKIVDLLIRAGADVNARGIDFPHATRARAPFAGSFALKIATIIRSHELVAHLLAKGARVNAICTAYTKPGARTALGAALLTRDMKNIWLLRNAGANIIYESLGVTRSSFDLDKLVHSVVKAGAEDLAEVVLDLCAHSGRLHTHWHSARAPHDCLLELAVRSRRIGMIHILLKHGISVNHADGAICNALLVAVRFRNYDMAKLLLEHAAAVSKPLSFESGSPLYAAIATKSVETTKLLLEYGAEVNKPPPAESETPLCAAIATKSIEVTKLLLFHGAEVNKSPFPESQLPLCAAIMIRSMEMTKLLLEHGAQVNKPPFCESESPLCAAVATNSIEMTQLLLSRGANLDLAPRYYRSPCALQIAIGNESEALIRLLIDHGADLTTTWQNADGEDCTPVCEAIFTAQPGIVKLLLEGGVQATSAMLLAAIRAKSRILVEMLIEYGVDLTTSLENADGEECGPVYQAVVTAQPSIVKLLLESGGQATSTILLAAIRKKSETLVRLLIEYGADPTATWKNAGGEDCGPVYEAVATAQSSIVQLLLERGAAATSAMLLAATPARTRWCEDSSPARVAIIELLLERLTKSDVRDLGRPLTTLEKAVEIGHPDIVKTMLRSQPEIELIELTMHSVDLPGEQSRMDKTAEGMAHGLCVILLLLEHCIPSGKSSYPRIADLRQELLLSSICEMQSRLQPRVWIHSKVMAVAKRGWAHADGESRQIVLRLTLNRQVTIQSRMEAFLPVRSRKRSLTDETRHE